jgi:hypothetical protein
MQKIGNIKDSSLDQKTNQKLQDQAGTFQEYVHVQSDGCKFRV